MLKDLGEIAVRLSRSPLGIIAFAFVFVYAIAGLLAWQANFEKTEREILVWFLAAFPVLVLLLFWNLVTRHHDKLYAPSDFTSDEAFIRVLEQRIQTSKAIRDLRSLPTEIQTQIDAQPLYRYTRLSEAGKRIVLLTHTRGELELSELSDDRHKQPEAEIESQATVLLRDYEWIERDGQTVRMTSKGKTEIETFIDLAWGRMK